MNDSARSSIPGGPLAAAIFAILCAGLPLASHVPPFAFACFLLALIARGLIHRHQLPLPGLPIKLLVLLLGAGGVYLSRGTLRGIESGIGVLLVLVSLKLLELRTARDFQVLTCLGWFLGLCRLFFSQTLTTWLQTAGIGLLLLGALIAFYGGRDAGRSAIRTTALLGAQAAPLIVLLFLLFPRATTAVRFSFSRGFFSETGLSDQLEPGGFTNLAQNDSPAFRVEFLNSPPPSPEHRYWRAAILWDCEGLNWRRGPNFLGHAALPDIPGQPSVRQRIVLQPHGGRWVLGLDWPNGEISGISASYETGEFFQSTQPIMQAVVYQVTSHPVSNRAALTGSERKAALLGPTRIPARANALVQDWRQTYRDDRAFVEHALAWVATENFNYTLDPGIYSGEGGFDAFLFDRRAGFCEHYAAAFATLMRLGGVPSRIVIGYFGGEFNELGNHFIVRQSDAHCWCEVWLAGQGWTRIDPTAVIAPDRVSAGLQSLIQSRAAQTTDSLAAADPRQQGWRHSLRRARLMWDNLNYQWDLRVLNYDESDQNQVLAWFGLGKLRALTLLLVLLLVVIAAVAALAAFMRHPWRRGTDPVRAAYARFCRALAMAGLTREPWEGPAAFAARAAGTFPQQAQFIEHATDLYIRHRYSAAPPPPHEFLHLMRRIPALRRPAAPV